MNRHSMLKSGSPRLKKHLLCWQIYAFAKWRESKGVYKTDKEKISVVNKLFWQNEMQRLTKREKNCENKLKFRKLSALDYV